MAKLIKGLVDNIKKLLSGIFKKKARLPDGQAKPVEKK